MPGTRSERGVTLLELLVVVAILGIVATLATLAVSHSIYRGRAAAILGDWKLFEGAVEQYQADFGRFPNDRSPYQEPPELRSYLRGKIDWSQDAHGYDFENWSGEAGNPDQSGTGVDIGFSVVTDDERLVDALRRVFPGELRQTMGNHYTFVIVPEAETAAASPEP